MFGAPKVSSAAKAREVRAWARDALGVPEEATILVTELQCSEPGCPPLETVIAVLAGAGQNTQYKLPCSIEAVSRDAVMALGNRPAAGQ